ncbi:hypothetical protein [Bacillus sp. E214]|uniref:hypothetical protein n=1 Tax=Bacillus sp. E214 TaxID=2587156 RepID=UPI0016527D8A|nr:hypothetical protein [Bacillus sp. E214]
MKTNNNTETSTTCYLAWRNRQTADGEVLIRKTRLDHLSRAEKVFRKNLNA